eukprot:CAMPEP_0170501710 /NCGR_PEP_ID=MMETSP0208-20121228/39184_1 /TAXON_ID=197538 /ORGANISM="Strombidium inclinatum, Strain S3" /LENGTH=47 /DNA_ID= /DNA_START= /DNA_END= /DNA_ORIENTATION=
MRGGGPPEGYPLRDSVILEEDSKNDTFNARASSLDATAPKIRRFQNQ